MGSLGDKVEDLVIKPPRFGTTRIQHCCNFGLFHCGIRCIKIWHALEAPSLAKATACFKPFSITRALADKSITMKPITDKDSTGMYEAAAAVMPESSVDTDHWWRYKNLRNLNLLLIFPLLSMFTLGLVQKQPSQLMSGFADSRIVSMDR
jgi:hypothetical protein